MTDELIEGTTAIGALEGLLELARHASEAPLPRVLASAAETISRSAGFRIVFMNVFRAASNDFSTAYVHGQDDIEQTRHDPPLPRDILSRLPGTVVQRAPGIFFVAGEPGMWDGHPNFHSFGQSDRDDPDAWRAEDLLLVMLDDTDGEPLGLVSVDDPTSGMRPTDGELRTLQIICLYVEQALRTARRAQQTEEDKRMLARLSEVSPQLSECVDQRELHRLVTATAADLGFERAAVYVRATGGDLYRAHVRGWESAAPPPDQLAGASVRATLTGRPEQSGSWLLHATELFGTTPPARSLRNGRGPLAWQDHCLAVPWVDGAGELAGVLVAEDPVDRLLPRDERRHALRLLVDLAASLENTIAQRARLHRLANRDTLTGLRNRRGLDQLIAEVRDCAVIVCDLDEFKQINDRYGHATGDLVLTRFAEILREHTRESDIAIRLGGDEFCVIMIGTDHEGAAIVAERIRSETPARMIGLGPRAVTVSVGVAHGHPGVPDPHALLTDADHALYGAKQGGRNRIVVAGGRVGAQ